MVAVAQALPLYPPEVPEDIRGLVSDLSAFWLQQNILIYTVGPEWFDEFSMDTLGRVEALIGELAERCGVPKP